MTKTEAAQKIAWLESKIDRHADSLILAESRIAFGHAETEDEWMRWHNDAEFHAEMVAAGERRLVELRAVAA